MFERIFVTTDGSVLGNSALPYAASLSRRYGAPLTLAYVVPDPYSHLAMLGPYTVSYTLEYKRGLEDGRQILDASARLLGGQDVSRRLLDGRTRDVADCLMEAVFDDGTELIVMSSHGHGGLMQGMLGSVTARVLHLATLPVMVVRPEKAGLPLLQPPS